ncbi:FAD-dependent oxidoreductase, partial [Pseudomonas kitaguniensis]|uniref:FAD-dependent oxidoreductase n=1 Tax=Pseudomonas kitaguniensis TaxID=2607908 RepID=UPI003CFD4031
MSGGSRLLLTKAAYLEANEMTSIIELPARGVKVVDRSDVVVVGGGPAGISAAVSAARNGASVTLIERYPYLG